MFKCWTFRVAIYYLLAAYRTIAERRTIANRSCYSACGACEWQPTTSLNRSRESQRSLADRCLIPSEGSIDANKRSVSPTLGNIPGTIFSALCVHSRSREAQRVVQHPLPLDRGQASGSGVSSCGFWRERKKREEGEWRREGCLLREKVKNVKRGLH